MNDLVVKSNYLIQAQYTLTLRQQQLLYIVLDLISKDDDELKTYNVSVKDYIKKTNSETNKDIYADMQTAVEGLRNRDLIFTSTKYGESKHFKWVSYAHYSRNRGYIEIGFDPRLKPYLLQLKEEFTKLSLARMLSFSSHHSCRVYELLKQYERIGSRTMSLVEFKGFLGFQPFQYKVYGELKRKVLIKAQTEINKNTDISFDFEEIKENKKVESLKFNIHVKKGTIENSADTKNINELVITTKEVDETEDKLKEIQKILENKITKGEARTLYIRADGDIEKIRQAYNYAMEVSKEQKIKNFMGFIIHLLELPEIPKLIKLNKIKNPQSNFEQRNYSPEYFKELERKLLGWDEDIVDEQDN